MADLFFMLIFKFLQKLTKENKIFSKDCFFEKKISMFCFSSRKELPDNLHDYVAIYTVIPLALILDQWLATTFSFFPSMRFSLLTSMMTSLSKPEFRAQRRICFLCFLRQALLTTL